MDASPTTEGSFFRKKPVVIEARQLDTARAGNDLVAWIKDHDHEAFAERTGIQIKTLEGWHRADVGDWIIKGVKGEFYPCKPDIFDMTYESASITPEPGEKCPSCNTPVMVAPGIGPFCPNKGCKRVDDLKGEPGGKHT